MKLAWMLAFGTACALCTGCGDSTPIPEDLSKLPIEERIDKLLGMLTLEEKVLQMHGLQLGPIEGMFHTPGIERFGIPGYRMVDGPRGVRAGKSTAFPVGMARGATWDPALELRVGRAMGLETAAKGGSVLLAPTINVLRHPGWGRAQETYGEDPVHLGEMAVAFIEGVQENVLASAKHFALNSIEDTRFSVDVTVDERTLREIYLPHFKRAVVDARVGSVMSAYNLVNGTYCAENQHLLGDILKGEWEFDGFVESDWLLGTRSTVDSALAGLDIEMPSSIFYGLKLVAAVEDGQVPLSKIDESVRRILRKQFEFDLDKPKEVDASVVESDEHKALALEVAEKSIVLLKNDTALPIDRDAVKKIAVIGSLADVENLGDKGSSAVKPTDAVTPLEGIQAAAGSVEVIHVGADQLSAADETAIAEADVAVVIVGLTFEDEGENIADLGGDRDSLALSDEHIALLQAVAAIHDRTIVVCEGGGALTMDWLADVESVLMAWYPGMEGGHAIASILFGEVNPSGRLPIVFSASESDLPPFIHDEDDVSYGYYHGYRHLDREGTVPLFPFGFGLSYTTFSYDSLDVSAAGGVLTAKVTLSNTGSRSGEEVVQLYVGYEGSAVERPERDLKAFARVAIGAGESKTVTLEVAEASLSYFDDKAGWKSESITYRIEVGPSSRDLPLSDTASF